MSISDMSALRPRLSAPPRVRPLVATPRSRALAAPAAFALLAVAAVHLVDGPGSLSDQFYIGALELALAIACVPLAVALLACPLPALWHAAGALCSAALLMFVASRTVGLPGSTDDIGNWGQLLGVVNVLFEVLVVGLAAAALRRRA